jgi:hypothetical protein
VIKREEERASQQIKLSLSLSLSLQAQELRRVFEFGRR